MEETVTILKSEYDRLYKDSVWLSCLEQAGVDNWEWIDQATDLFEVQYQEED